MGSGKIQLGPEQETLLVPLYSKALEGGRRNPILVDPMAEEILAGLDYDFAKLKVPKQTLVTLAMRARRLDWYVSDYLCRFDAPIVLHLGCGLDSRERRVGGAKGSWYDVDYPEVIELRRHFYRETERYRMIGSSVSDYRWLEEVRESGPACIIAEGLFMYLSEAEVRSLLLALQARFPGRELAFDAFSVLTARSVAHHPSIKRTGAAVKWGIDDPRRIESWGINIGLMEEWHFTESEGLASLGAFYRLLFRTMGALPAARRAHRVLRFHL